MRELGITPVLLQAQRLFLLATGLSILLFLFGAARNQSMYHWYLIWNLGLAWVPFLLSVVLVKILETRLWSEWPPLLITFAWFFFLPNTFYMLTDYIHLNDVPRSNHVFDIAMFSSFIFTGIALGYVSLAVMHLELRKRFSTETTWRIIAFIMLISSFAIYIGRELRWNSWDIIGHPAGILFDVSEQLIHPWSHLQTYSITLSYFVLFGFLYGVLYVAVRALRRITL
jgi:uncharacterized membrane protein